MKNKVIVSKPVTDIEEYKKLLKQTIEEINNNIYFYDDHRKITIRYKGKACIIKENYTNRHIDIYFVYEENPHDPIDDADTGSGYYLASEEDSELADEVRFWYKYIYLKNKAQVKLKEPDIIWFKEKDGTITNYPKELYT